MIRPVLITPLFTAALLAAASPASAAAPGNDDFERAAAITTSVTGMLDEATRQPDEPAHGLQSVWYAYRPTTSGRVAVEMVRADTTVNLAVYTGPGVGQLHEVGASEAGARIRVAIDAQAGQTYWLAVATPYESAGTRFQMRVAPAPLPANDAFAEARAVSVPGRYEGSTADASDELGEPNHLHASANRSVWYRFRAARTGRLTIEAEGVISNCDPGVAVYTGTDVASLRKVGEGRTVRFRARRGRTYRVAVDCPFPSTGGFVLTLSDGSIKGKGVELEPVAGQTVQSVRRGGLRTTVTTQRKVTVGIELTISRTAARELGLDSRVLGRARGTLGYNQKLPAVIRLTSDAKLALRGEETLSAVVKLTLLKTNAPNRVLTVPVKLPN